MFGPGKKGMLLAVTVIVRVSFLAILDSIRVWISCYSLAVVCLFVFEEAIFLS